MDIKFGIPNKSYHNNRICRTKYSLWYVPIVTVYQYFKSRENFYFLVLAVFQLLTLGPLPAEYSPTGPYSTAIPLALCILIEIIISVISWTRITLQDQKENHKLFYCFDVNRNFTYNKKITVNSFERKFNKDIYPGHIIYLEKDDICPIDGIFLQGDVNDDYAKINMGLLTGESNINYVAKVDRKYSLNDYIGSKVLIEEYYPNDLLKLKGRIYNLPNRGGEDNLLLARQGNLPIREGDYCPITGKNLVVAGSIVRSPGVYIWTLACGKGKKSKLHVNKYKKYSRIDQFIGKYMVDISVWLLFSMVVVTSLIKMYSFGNLNPITFVIYCIQNWILFNGIIPFSIKIILILARNIESYLVDKPYYSANESLQIDDLPKVKRIICDKTGTITKNQLEFVKIIPFGKNSLVDIAQFDYDYKYIGLEFFKCLGLCIHFAENDYATIEDRIIRTGYEAMRCTYQQKDNQIELNINQNTYNYEYVNMDGFDFNYDRKMSSKIVKDNDIYSIYSKGSVDVIYERLKPNQRDELRRVEKIISSEYPELRLLAFAYRQFNINELTETFDNEIYNSLENDMIFLGIIGIKDIVHPNVDKTIAYLEHHNISVNLCTGDRRITAIEVSKQVGIIKPTDEIIDIHDVRSPTETKLKILTFGSLNTIDIISGKAELLKECLSNCKSFVGYGMTPADKKEIARIYENSKTTVLAIGDGFNDIGMFTESAVSVAVRTNGTVENSADFTVNNFIDLEKLMNYSTQCYHKNANLINLTFYRCSTVIFALMTYALINIWNHNEFYKSPLNGFVLQGFNFAWTFIGLVYYVFITKKIGYNDFENAVLMASTSFKITSIWNILGIINGIVIVLFFDYFTVFAMPGYDDLLAIIIISMLNIKLLKANRYGKLSILFALMGVLNYILYMVYMGNIINCISFIYTLPINFWLVLAGYLLVF